MTNQNESNIIPIIDISPLLNPLTSTEKQQTVDKITDALANSGFFYIINHGISLEEQKQILNEAKKFFALPLEQKKKIERASIEITSSTRTGYEAIGVQSEDDSNPHLIDQKEALDIFVGDLHHPMNKSNKLNDGPLTGFQDRLPKFQHQLFIIGDALLRAFSVAMGQPEDFFATWYKEPSSSFRFLRYPPTPEISDGNFIGCGAHSDYGVLTILMQDDIGGLQVDYNNKWIDAVPIPGSFVINVGDCVEFMSNGALKAARHFVINKSHVQERFAVALFHAPAWEMPLYILDKYKNQEKNHKTTLPPTFGDHITSRFRATYAKN